jgi:hypothetical protein
VHVEGDYEKWELRLVLPGATQREAFVYLPLGSSAEDAKRRLLG